MRFPAKASAARRWPGRSQETTLAPQLTAFNRFTRLKEIGVYFLLRRLPRFFVVFFFSSPSVYCFYPTHLDSRVFILLSLTARDSSLRTNVFLGNRKLFTQSAGLITFLRLAPRGPVGLHAGTNLLSRNYFLDVA